MLAQVDQRTFLTNICLLGGLLVIGGLFVILVIATWTGTKIGIWEFRRWRAEQEERRRKQFPGVPADLPVGPGVCGRCFTASDNVYTLPAGERCCPSCFQHFFGESESANEAHEDSRD